MKKKKKIVFHSNHSRAFTGFGKNCKNILLYLHSTGKYEIVEFANGSSWSAPDLKTTPWKTFGSLPDDPSVLQKLNQDPQLGRQAGYGANMVDEIIRQEKPDVYIGAEDIWAFNGYTGRNWWNKTNCMIWTTLDSLPILPDAVNNAASIKNYYVWATFAEKALRELGHDHVRTLHGAVDTSSFYRLEDEKRAQLRNYHGLPIDSFIIGFVFRNQLRKSVPNILDGFAEFIKQEPSSKALLLLHTHWSEGWDIPRLLKEKSIDAGRVITTYFCSACSAYEVRPFSGQGQNCKVCGSKTLNTTNVKDGVSEIQLNEIYNLMDVYCHPFTSGGQELPIQEAKLTELITLATNYSCGEDSCSPESGGIPLDWAEYREPGTQFIKATTYWDFDFSFKKKNPDYTPPNIVDDTEWIKDLYKNILNNIVDNGDQGLLHWIQRLKTDMNRHQVLDYFKSVASKENNENKKVELKDLFIENSNKKALMVCNGDLNLIFNATALLPNFSETYKDTDLYFACPPQVMSMLDGNPYIKKVIPYHESMENELAMIGRGPQEKLVDHYINFNKMWLQNLSSINGNI